MGCSGSWIPLVTTWLRITGIEGGGALTILSVVAADGLSPIMPVKESREFRSMPRFRAAPHASESTCLVSCVLLFTGHVTTPPLRSFSLGEARRYIVRCAARRYNHS